MEKAQLAKQTEILDKEKAQLQKDNAERDKKIGAMISTLKMTISVNSHKYHGSTESGMLPDTYKQ